MERILGELQGYSDFSLHSLACSNRHYSAFRLEEARVLESGKCARLAELLPALRVRLACMQLLLSSVLVAAFPGRVSPLLALSRTLSARCMRPALRCLQMGGWLDSSDASLLQAEADIVRHAVQAKGSRPLIFSQWTQVLDVLEWLMDLLKLPYSRLDGSTAVADRQAIVDQCAPCSCNVHHALEHPIMQLKLLCQNGNMCSSRGRLHQWQSTCSRFRMRTFATAYISAACMLC